MKEFNIEEIKALITQINDVVQEVHSDEDDEVGAIVWNNCLAIAEMMGFEI